MQIRVVVEQPWDAAAHLLVVPVIGEPAFDGELGELDRRTGGELRALATFGELKAKRYSTALAAAGELPAARVLVVSGGPADEFDRETVRRLAAAAIRRLGGRKVRPPRSGCRRSPTPSTVASPWRPSSSPAASSRAASSPRRSTARTSTLRRRRSTS